MHRIDGPGATPENMFTDGDPVAGTPATVVTDEFMNDVQEELISLLTAAGITPVKGTQDQVLKSLAKLLQVQKLTAFPAAGTATALTLAPSPAIDGYEANQSFRVKFVIASGANPTLNVSGKGAKALKQYDSTGAKVAAVFAAGQLSLVEYDGVDWILLDQLPAASDLFNTARVDVASAGTVNLTTAAPSTRHINVTGSTTISGFTVAAGQCYFVRFDGALQLTNSATLVTQSGGNILTQAGDTCMLRATSANSVEVLCYTRSPKSGCTAWVSWNGTGTVAVRDSYNVSSITDNGVGDFTVNLATTMANANYSFTYTVGGNASVLNMASGATAAPTTSALRVTSVSAAGLGAGASFAMTDFPINNVQIFGGK